MNQSLDNRVQTELEPENCELLNLAHKIHYFCIRGGAHSTFISSVTRLMLDHSSCDEAIIWLEEGRWYYRCEANKFSEKNVSFSVVPEVIGRSDMAKFRTDSVSRIEQFHRDVLKGTYPTNSKNFSTSGSFWTEDITKTDNNYIPRLDKDGTPIIMSRTLALIPIRVSDQRVGLLRLSSLHPSRINEKNVKDFEYLAEVLGIAFEHFRTQAALRERIKELTCLYNIARISTSNYGSIPEALALIVHQLPGAWHYPEITMGRIILDDYVLTTENFYTTNHVLKAAITVLRKTRGQVEVYYQKAMPELDEGPFLIEERSLLNTIAHQISVIVERVESRIEKEELQDQLRHADRLATIGQLAAGVAHEINEPLGNILGFAQLAKKNEGTPVQTLKDLERIENASLHAREVIRNLLTFARQDQIVREPMQLNDSIDEALYFIESRCAKADIDLVTSFEKDLPLVKANSMQMSQVLINLAVNSMHAMPDGGELKISTSFDEKNVYLLVEDTGCGITDEIIGKIFLPFFTTKKVNEGTGLGLAVVHSIITSYNGKIKVESKANTGAKFTITIPRIQDSN